MNISKTWSIVVGIVVALVAVVAFSLSQPKLLTGLFFGVNTSPVAMNLKETFEPREPDAQTQAIVLAANKLLASLDSEQKNQILYKFSDNEQRSSWSNFPEGMIPRGGIKLGSLSQDQRDLLDKLLGEVMSKEGMINIDQQLVAEETFPKNSFNKYGVEHFYAAFLGEPSETQPWMFMFGGHHLAINVTVYGADVSFSPMLTGGQPLHIDYKGQKIFITEKEAKAAQRFLASLNDKQKSVAIRGDKAIDLLLGPGEYGTVVLPEGVKGSELNDFQKSLLIALIDTRLGFLNEDDNRATMEKVQAELDDTYFAWWGPQDKLGFAYFRVTGPSLVLEYAPQADDGDTVIDHNHRMYRDPVNDYGSAWVGGNLDN